MKKTVSILLCMILVMQSTFALRFLDVSQGAWYFEPIESLASQGKVNGYGDGSFKPDAQVTHAEAMALILKVSGIVLDVQAGNHWAKPYFDHAKAYGVILDTDLYDQPISRLQFAQWLTTMLGYKEVNHTSPFVDCSDVEAVKLYELGIIKGVDSTEDLAFLPDKSLSRAELTTILYRASQQNLLVLVEGPVRVSPRVSSSQDVTAFIKNKQWDKVVYHMMASGTFEATYDLKALNVYMGVDEPKVLIEAAMASLALSHVDLTTLYEGYGISYTYDKGGTISKLSLSLKSRSLNGQPLSQDQILEAIAYVDQTTQALLDQGLVTATMAPIDQAKAVYDWIILAHAYDLDFSDAAYSVVGSLRNKKMVCQGYTALYNGILSRLGMTVLSQSGTADGGGHMWSKLMIDDQVLWVDTTWGDPVPNTPGYVNDAYFNMLEKDLRLTHQW